MVIRAWIPSGKGWHWKVAVLRGPGLLRGEPVQEQERAIPCALDNGALEFLLRYEYFVHSVQL